MYLEIAIQHAARMQILQAQHHLSAVELHAVLGQTAVGLQVREQLTAVDEVHHEAPVRACMHA